MTNKILLHICCVPCAVSVEEKLRAAGYELVGYFYNPNIQPQKEYFKRLATAKKLTKIFDFKILEEKYQPDEHLEVTKNLEKPDRCLVCYQLRLEKTAQKATMLDIKYFTSTLLISPYQDLKKIRHISRRLAKKYQLEFFDQDFAKDFRAGHKKAHELGLYCQKYCGCLKSINER